MLMQGTRIRERRVYLVMSQEELADRIGTSQKQISRYERGENDPTGEVLIALARALNTSADWLLGLADQPERPVETIDGLTEIERELLRAFRRKPPLKQADIVEIVKLV